jgi:hypothetical protein
MTKNFVHLYYSIWSIWEERFQSDKFHSQSPNQQESSCPGSVARAYEPELHGELWASRVTVGLETDLG